MERMKRRWSQFTMEDIQKIADHTPVERYSTGSLRNGEYTPELSDVLSGKEIKIVLDNGSQYQYRFEDREHLLWKESKGEFKRESCQIMQAPSVEAVFLVQHYCAGSVPPTAHTLVLDFDTGLVTLCIAHLGVPEAPREVSRKFQFGIMDGFKTEERHHFTTDLVGKSICWTYHEKDNIKIRHIYTAPLYYTYYMTDAEGRCWVASNPADYVKVRDELYIFSFVEERQAGTQGFFLINLNTLHDVGSFFGLQATGLECYTFGAKGEFASPYIKEL